SPAEETVGIVPLLRGIEIETVQPALLGSGAVLQGYGSGLSTSVLKVKPAASLCALPAGSPVRCIHSRRVSVLRLSGCIDRLLCGIASGLTLQRHEDGIVLHRD